MGNDQMNGESGSPAGTGPRYEASVAGDTRRIVFNYWPRKAGL